MLLSAASAFFAAVSNLARPQLLDVHIVKRVDGFHPFGLKTSASSGSDPAAATSSALSSYLWTPEHVFTETCPDGGHPLGFFCDKYGRTGRYYLSCRRVGADGVLRFKSAATVVVGHCPRGTVCHRAGGKVRGSLPNLRKNQRPIGTTMQLQSQMQSQVQSQGQDVDTSKLQVRCGPSTAEQKAAWNQAHASRTHRPRPIAASHKDRRPAPATRSGARSGARLGAAAASKLAAASRKQQASLAWSRCSYESRLYALDTAAARASSSRRHNRWAFTPQGMPADVAVAVVHEAVPAPDNTPAAPVAAAVSVEPASAASVATIASMPPTAPIAAIIEPTKADPPDLVPEPPGSEHVPPSTEEDWSFLDDLDLDFDCGYLAGLLGATPPT